MANFDRDGIEFFIGGSDKNPPPVFVGRHKVLEDVVRVARRAWTLRETGESGVTRIIQGAPGAGKSSILAELNRQLNVGKPNQGEPRILNLDSVELTAKNLPLTLKKLAEMIDAKAAVSFIPDVGQDISVGVSANIIGTGGGLNVSSGRTRAPFSASLAALQTWIVSNVKGKAMQWPIIVAVDEAQNLPAGNQTEEAQLLRGFHACTIRQPITLVLAGLSNTEQVADSLGLTRGLHFHRIGCLDGNDRVEVLLGFCDRFGIEIGSCRGNLELLAKHTDGWPRHLHWVLIAIAKAALAKGIDGELDRITDWDELERESQQSRNDYYLRQQGELLRQRSNLVAAVLIHLNESFTAGDVQETIEASTGTSVKWILPPNMDSEQFYRQLVRRGVLEERANGTVHCPIPSFKSFLISKGVGVKGT